MYKVKKIRQQNNQGHVTIDYFGTVWWCSMWEYNKLFTPIGYVHNQKNIVYNKRVVNES